MWNYLELKHSTIFTFLLKIYIHLHFHKRSEIRPSLTAWRISAACTELFSCVWPAWCGKTIVSNSLEIGSHFRRTVYQIHHHTACVYTGEWRRGSNYISLHWHAPILFWLQSYINAYLLVITKELAAWKYDHLISSLQYKNIHYMSNVTRCVT